MKLRKWCEKQGICYLTGLRWFHNNLIPNARQLPTGTIIINEQTITQNINNKETMIYCRVSNHNRKKELEYQVERCQQFCFTNGYSVVKTYKEIASGMNDNRRELWKMLDKNPTRIVIENKDRLTRFGFNYLQKLLQKQNCEIIVINQEHEDEKDLMKDLISVITSFCCRLYGLRKGMNKTKKIKQVITKND